MAYYGSNGYGGSDTNPYALFLEAMEHAVREIDLQDYDADGDGYVDNVHIVFAGYGEEAGASPPPSGRMRPCSRKSPCKA